MKFITKARLVLALTIFCFFTACNTTPVIIPDISTNAAQHADTISQRNGWGWILWYLPVLFLAVAWGWTVLVKRKKINAES
jgi:hypothetical protein